MNKKQISITLGIMCLLLTVAICVQIKTMNSANSTVSQTLEDNGLRDEVLKMKEKYDNTYQELERAQKELEEVRQSASKNNSEAETKEQELKENNMILGNINVLGEGVEVILQDATNSNNILDPSKALIHYTDLLWVVNELNNSGAEAIEINGQRFISTSAITCEGNIIKINGERIGSPFKIKAIGSQSLLYGSLTRTGSYLDVIKEGGNIVEVKKVKDITISKFNGVIKTEYIKNK